MALTRVCNHGVSRKDERWIPCFLLRLAPLRYSSSVPGATSDRSSISFSINLHWHRGPLPSQLPFNALNSKSYNVVHFGRTSSSIKFFQLFSFIFFFFYIDRDTDLLFSSISTVYNLLWITVSRQRTTKGTRRKVILTATEFNFKFEKTRSHGFIFKSSCGKKILINLYIVTSIASTTNIFVRFA